MKRIMTAEYFHSSGNLLLKHIPGDFKRSWSVRCDRAILSSSPWFCLDRLYKNWVIWYSQVLNTNNDWIRAPLTFYPLTCLSHISTSQIRTPKPLKCYEHPQIKAPSNKSTLKSIGIHALQNVICFAFHHQTRTSWRRQSKYYHFSKILAKLFFPPRTYLLLNRTFWHIFFLKME